MELRPTLAGALAAALALDSSVRPRRRVVCAARVAGAGLPADAQPSSSSSSSVAAAAAHRRETTVVIVVVAVLVVTAVEIEAKVRGLADPDAARRRLALRAARFEQSDRRRVARRELELKRARLPVLTGTVTIVGLLLVPAP